MKILVKILHKFFPLLVITLILIGNSCLLSPKERSNPMDAQLDDNEFVLTYEFVYSGNNQSDTEVLLTWSSIEHELLDEYIVYRRSQDTLTIRESLYHYDTTITGSIIGSTFLFAYDSVIRVESTLVLGSTDNETNLFLDTTFQTKKVFNIYYIAATFIGADDYFYFSNLIELW